MDTTKSATLAKHVESQKIKGLLYHYTSGTGLKGILSGRELWMTNTLYLNDHQELKHLGEVAKSVAISIIDDGGLNKEERGFLDLLSNSEVRFSSYYYVSSFSEDGDSLPQWRGYCPEIGGFSLGIPTENLKRIIDDENRKIELDINSVFQGDDLRSKAYARTHRSLVENGPNYKFFLLKCIYDEGIQRQIAREIVQYYLDRFRGAMAHISRGDIETEFEVASVGIVNEYLMYLEKVSAIVKHHSFDSEREWRIVSPRIDILSPDVNNTKLASKHLARVDYRETNRGLIHYYRLNLGDTPSSMKAITKDLSHVEIVCGPTANKVGATEAAKTMLRKYGFSPRCRESIIPYKTW